MLSLPWPGLVPGLGTKILQASQCGPPPQKKNVISVTSVETSWIGEVNQNNLVSKCFNPVFPIITEILVLMTQKQVPLCQWYYFLRGTVETVTEVSL